MDKKILDKIIEVIVSFLKKDTKPVQVTLDEEPKKVAPPAPPKIIPITKKDLLMGRDKTYADEYTKEISDNLDKLLIVLNKIQEKAGRNFHVNSGWRPAAINAAISGAAVHSNHTKGLAADISDPTGSIMYWVLDNLEFMKELGVFMEDFRWTPTWVHFQIVPVHSGHRIFIPNMKPAPAPERWDGRYDPSMNA